MLAYNIIFKKKLPYCASLGHAWLPTLQRLSPNVSCLPLSFFLTVSPIRHNQHCVNAIKFEFTNPGTLIFRSTETVLWQEKTAHDRKFTRSLSTKLIKFQKMIRQIPIWHLEQMCFFFVFFKSTKQRHLEFPLLTAVIRYPVAKSTTACFQMKYEETAGMTQRYKNIICRPRNYAPLLGDTF